MTVMMPADFRLSITDLRESLSQATVLEPPPRLMLMDATGKPPGEGLVRTWLSAEIWSEVKASTQGAVPVPPQLASSLNRVKTWIAMIFADLATPLGGSLPLWLVLNPAAMPATCEPW